MLRIFKQEPPELITKGPYSFRTSRPKYDRYVLEEIWDRDVYGIEEFTSHLEGAIIDIGAHIGGFTGKARQKWTTNPIYAFEPHPKNARLFRKNARANGWQQIRFFAKAITSRTQSVKLHLDPKNSAGHSLLDREDQRSISVGGMTISDLIKREVIAQIGLLKLDCEGSEYDILTTIPTDLLQQIQFLIVEWHPFPQYNRVHIDDRLRNAGFRVIRKQPDQYIPNQELTTYERIN